MRKTIARPVLCFFGLLAVLMPASASAETYVFDFPTSLEGWQQQWDIEEPSPGSPGMVSHSTVRGYNDGASLLFDMGDGFGDDGTLWIEKSFPTPADVPVHVSLSFQLYNQSQSDFNQFGVGAVISRDNPERQSDFATLGITDTAEGWVPFMYEQTLPPGSDEVWVAIGIHVAWETHRDYWIDHVVVTTTPIPEPATGGLVLVGLAALALVMRARFRI